MKKWILTLSLVGFCLSTAIAGDLPQQDALPIKLPIQQTLTNYQYMQFGFDVIVTPGLFYGFFQKLDRLVFQELLHYTYYASQNSIGVSVKAGYEIIPDFYNINLELSGGYTWTSTSNIGFGWDYLLNIEASHPSLPFYIKLGFAYYPDNRGFVFSAQEGLRISLDFMQTNYRSIDAQTKRRLITGGYSNIIVADTIWYPEFYSLGGNFNLDFTLIDSPFNTSQNYALPSMQQSMDITFNLTRLTRTFNYYLIDLLDIPFALRESSTNRTILTPVGYYYLLPFILSVWEDYLLGFVPGGYVWLHQEWRRAVLKNRGIDSYSELNGFPSFTNLSLIRVSDADLVRLKALYPADMVRLAVAGYEANLEYAHKLRQDVFFHRKTDNIDVCSMFGNVFFNSLFVTVAGMTNVDPNWYTTMTNEGTNVMTRDVFGRNMTAWVYDLSRPNEPYTNRGAHPSGVGIKRYILTSDLTAEELGYLQLQGWLTWLNLVSPSIFGFNRFEAVNPLNGKPFYWNFALQHHLTSFGFDVAVDLFYKQGDLNLFAAVHSYFNKQNYFPGLELEVVDYPLRLGEYTVSLSGSAHLWLQPQSQSFATGNGQFGAFASFKARFPVIWGIGTFFEIDAKTAGWKAGNVYLDPAVQARAGLSLTL